MLITGGAGFIGVNAADKFCSDGWKVSVLDNLSRRGAKENLEWLTSRHDVSVVEADIRNSTLMEKSLSEMKPNVLLHLAGQVAVTSSVEDPSTDFDINARGTLNLLEAVRKFSADTFFINASTNKVYGKMEDLDVRELDSRYVYSTLTKGVNEERPLDFHSPYGCSKGVADQYCIDYARIYDLCTVSMRQSCIYGPRQFGIEDQGWVAWFCIAAAMGEPITIYGDGKQIRDILYVGDLVQAYEAAIDNMERVNGRAINIGGGPANTLSLLELLSMLKNESGTKLMVNKSDWRPGDQKVFVSDITKARKFMNWNPTTSLETGMKALIDWTLQHKALFV